MEIYQIFLISILPFVNAASEQRFRVVPENATSTEGDTVILQCHIDSQKGQAQWAKDGFALGYQRALPGYGRYRMIGDPTRGQHDLRIENVTGADQGRFQCQVAPHGAHPAIRAAAYLTVLVKPKQVTLTASSAVAIATDKQITSSLENNLEVAVMSAETVSLTCDVTGSRPSSEIDWYRNAVLLNPANNDIEILREELAENHTRSVLSFIATPEDNDVQITCQAKHPSLNKATLDQYSRSATLKVLFAPGDPEIVTALTHYHRIGETVKLVCRSVGGQPPAQLVWYRDGQQLQQQSYRVLDTNGASRNQTVTAETTVTVNIDRETPLANFMCQSFSLVQPKPKEVTARILVAFGPQAVLISAPSVARRSDSLPLVCNVTGSNPAPEVEWSIDNRFIETSMAELVKAEGEDRWNFSYSVLTQLPDSLATSDLVVKCIATNTQTKEAQTSSTHVQLLYPPTFSDNVGEKKIRATVGSRLRLKHEARANPPNIRYSWWKGAKQVQETSDTPVLLFDSVTRSDAGVYLVNASNSEGWTSETVTLIVQYPPLLELAPTYSVTEGSNVTLDCHIDASPLNADMVVWSDKSGSLTDSPTTRVNFADHSSRLTLIRVSRDHAGSYQCSVDNGAGTKQTSTQLMVKYLSMEDDEEAQDRVAVGLGSSGLLQCKVSGFPNPEILWFKNNKSLENDDGFSISLKKIGKETWLSELRFFNVKPSYYGKIECRASNEISVVQRYIDLQDESIPEAPKFFSYHNVTDTTVLLTWQPAFNGGLSQRFLVRYWPVGEYEELKIIQKDGGSGNGTIIENLFPGTTYNISVTAQNSLGSQTAEKILSFKTEGAILSSTTNMLHLAGAKMPWLIVIIICSIGGILLVSNLALVVFVLRRKRHTTGQGNEHLSSPSEASTKSETVQTYVNETTSSLSMKSDAYPSDDIPDHFTVEVTRDSLGVYSGGNTNRLNGTNNAMDDCNNYVHAIRRNSAVYKSAPLSDGRRLQDRGGVPANLFPPRAPCFDTNPRQNLLTPDLLTSGSYSCSTDTGIKHTIGSGDPTVGTTALLTRSDQVFAARASADRDPESFSRVPSSLGCAASGSPVDVDVDDISYPSAATMPALAAPRVTDNFINGIAASDIGVYTDYTDYAQCTTQGSRYQVSDPNYQESNSRFQVSDPNYQESNARFKATESELDPASQHYYPRRTYIHTDGDVLHQHLMRRNEQNQHQQQNQLYQPDPYDQQHSLPSRFCQPPPNQQQQQHIPGVNYLPASVMATESPHFDSMPEFHASLANTATPAGGNAIDSTRSRGHSGSFDQCDSAGQVPVSALTICDDSDDFEHRGHLV